MATWATANARASKQTRTLVAFSGLTTRYSDGPIQAETAATSTLLLAIDAALSRFDPVEFTSQVGRFSFTLLDSGGAISTLIGANEMRERQVTIKAGYHDVDEADYVTIAVQDVQQVTQQRHGEWTFICEDLQQDFRAAVFTGATAAAKVTKEDNVIDFVLRVLTSTGAGTNGAYDTYAASDGLAIPQARIDIAAIEAERAKFHFWKSVRFIFDEPIDDWKRFMEEQVFRPFNLRGIIQTDGTFTIKTLRPPLPDETATTLTDGDLLDDHRIDLHLRWAYNRITYEYDYDEDANTYGATVSYTDTGSTLAEAHPITIRSQGIRTNLNGTDMTRRLANAIFGEFGSGPPEVEVSTRLEQRTIETGDIVTVTSSTLPDPFAGTQSTSALQMEVLETIPDLDRGRMRFRLIDSGFDLSAAYRMIAPNGTANYDGQSAAVQALYGSIADATPSLGAAEDPPHLIFPG